MCGVKLVINRHLCQPRFVRWRRTHRNNRIARKWHKRWGPVMRCENASVVRLGDTVACCPCQWPKLLKAFGDEPQAGTYSAAFVANQQFENRFR